MKIRLQKDELYPVYYKIRDMKHQSPDDIEVEVPEELWNLYEDTLDTLVSLGDKLETVTRNQ